MTEKLVRNKIIIMLNVKFIVYLSNVLMQISEQHCEVNVCWKNK